MVETAHRDALPAAVVPVLAGAAAARGLDWDEGDVRAVVRVRPATHRWRRPSTTEVPRDLVGVAERHVAAGERYLAWCDRGQNWVGWVVAYAEASVRDTSVVPRTRGARAGGIALHGNLGPLGRTHTVTIGDSQPALTFRETVLALAGRIIEV